MSDDSFPEVVRKAWSGQNNLYSSISKFSRDASYWNWVHFGNIFAKKKRIMARLNGIQNAMADRPSASLIALEKEP